MLIDTNTELVPRGIYKVGEKFFTNKIEALIYSDAVSIHPTWDFNDNYFSI